jgi:hypothetical protein
MKNHFTDDEKRSFYFVENLNFDLKLEMFSGVWIKFKVNQAGETSLIITIIKNLLIGAINIDERA